MKLHHQNNIRSESKSSQPFFGGAHFSSSASIIQAKPLMMKSEGGGGVATSAFTSQLNSSKGGGSPLPASTNQFMSNAFGSDFSGVRVHTGSNAIQMNQGLNARAFTHGSDLYFNKGEYSPNSSEGKRLLGHELTHVVQQGGGNIQQKASRVPAIQRAVIDSRIRIPERRVIIQSALRRVGFVVSGAIAILEQLRSGSGTRRQQQALFSAFLIDSSSPDSASLIGEVISKYQGALDILQATSTQISVIRDTGFADAWGYAPIGEELADQFTHEIRVGNAFFRASPRNARFAAIMEACASPPGDMGLLRAVTLVHEAIHWVNGVGGHMTTGIDPTLHLGLNGVNTLSPPGNNEHNFTLGGESGGNRFGVSLLDDELTPLPSSLPLLTTPRSNIGTEILIKNPYRYEMFILSIRCGSEAAGFSQGFVP